MVDLEAFGDEAAQQIHLIVGEELGFDVIKDDRAILEEFLSGFG